MSGSNLVPCLPQTLSCPVLRAPGHEIHPSLTHRHHDDSIMMYGSYGPTSLIMYNSYSSTEGSRPSRKPAEADLRGTMNRSESMDPSVPHPPSTRGHRAEVVDHRTVSQSLQDWMETRVADIIKTICETTSIPRKVQHKVSIELQNLVVDFAAQQVFVTKTEEQYMNQVKDLERQLLDASSDFSDESGEPTRRELLAIIASQREELQVKENQLNGKRILWLASHPPASQLRSSDTNPFTLPGGSSRSHSQLQLEAPPAFNNSHSGYRSSGRTSMTRLSRASLAAMENAAIGDQMSPTQEEYNRVKASVSVAVPDSALENVPSILNMRNHMHSETETVINHRRSQMPLVPYKSQPSNVHDTGKEFTNDFGNLFASMEGWCREYACVPNLAGDRTIASTNQELWNYMMGVTYNDPQSAHSHVMALLGNENTRFWFVMRLALDYCFKKIMCIETYEKYNHSVKEHLVSLRERLAAKPIISNEKRQALVAEQTALIKSVIKSPDYVTFRNDMLVHHTKRLRDILGPLMNQGCSRTKAGGDLGVMIISSMEICAKMWTAKLSFQIVFPDLLGVKFTAGTMTPKDHPRDNPYQLQTKQKRLKLVMTPSITMRDDNSITIIAKNLHKANVLLMT